MSQSQIEIMLIAAVVSLACSLVGVFLVLRKMSMMSDAITHTVLLGIVLAFFITNDLSSPLLMFGAVVMGLITVFLIEGLQKTRLLSEEASIGVVFPFIFSIAIILISRYAGSAHLDTDAVLLGELSFAPLDRMEIFGLSLPKALVTSAAILIINFFVVALFFKELKLSSFDPVLAASLGFSPALLNYVLMSLVSVTAVGAFNAVGSILVIAFMIGPAVSAYLWTHDLKRLMMISAVIALCNVVVGYHVARFFDVSIAGSMAVVTGLSFSFSFFVSKKQGYLMRKLALQKQRRQYNKTVLLLKLHDYVHRHRATVTMDFLRQHIYWPGKKIACCVRALQREQYIGFQNTSIVLTEVGYAYVKAHEENLLMRQHP